MTGIFRLAQKVLEKIFFVFQGLCSAWLVVLMILISVDVFGRAFFARPLRGTPELVSFSIVIIAFLLLPYVLMMNRQIRITMLYDRVGPLGKDIIDLASSLVGVMLFIMLIMASWNGFIRAIRISEFIGEGALRLATSPARGLLILGSAFVVLQFLFNAGKSAYSIYNRVRGKGSVC